MQFLTDAFPQINFHTKVHRWVNQTKRKQKESYENFLVWSLSNQAEVPH